MIDTDGIPLPDIVRFVHAAAPELTEEEVRGIVIRVATIEKTQRLLQLALINQPGLLHGAQANVPRTVQALCHALVAAGAQRIVLPTCESCERSVSLPHKAPGGGRHCSRCERNRRATACAQCGQVQPIQRRIDGNPLCRACWRVDPRSFDTCDRCGNEATLVVRKDERICLACYTAPIKPCSICKEPGPVATHIDGGRVCARCYYSMRRPRLCPECARKRFLTNLLHNHLVCAECAGKPITMACPGCGSITESRKHHLCARCRRPGVIHQLLADRNDEIRPELQPLAHYLLSHHPNPEALTNWILKSRGAETLRGLANGTLALEPRAIIEQLENPRTVSFLLSLLVASDTIPEFDVQRARFEHWMRGWIASIDDPLDRTVLRRYSAWGLSGPTYRSILGDPKAKYRRHRSMLNHAASLLAAAHGMGHTLDTLPQRELDAFITGSTSQRDALAHFTQWLRRMRLSRLVVEYRHNELEARGFSTDHRWTMARYLIEGSEIPPADRVGGLLVLLYGMQSTRVVAIERSQVIEADGTVRLKIGAEPIELPTPLDEALSALLKQSLLRSERWLFVGRHPGEHLTADGLSKRLAAHGMRIRSARATALLELAQQMHPRVLSDLLGISTTTAAKWWRLAGGDWAAYPPLR